MSLLFSQRAIAAACIILIAAVLLSGCSSSGGADSAASSGEGATFRLNVAMSASPLYLEANGQSVSMPIQVDSYLLQLLDPSGRTLQSQQVLRAGGEDILNAAFDLTDPGSYRIRASAFDANQTILGTYDEPIDITGSESTLKVDTIEAAELYFTIRTDLPQAKSAEGFTNFLSRDQSGIHLQSYCFWGYLLENGKPVNAYLSIIQRMDEVISDLGSFMFPVMMAGAGYNNQSTAHIIFGGSGGIADLNAAVTLTQPWHASVETANNPPTPLAYNVTDMKVLDGTMGQAGARYQMTSSTKDLEGGTLQTDVVVRDIMGMVNEGYGPASFFPQWLMPAQQTLITNIYGGSVEKYLAATSDPMVDQGSCYYSAPMLKVESFSITRNSQVISQGSDGLLWMDIVYQSFDTSAQAVVSSATWNFFSIQFPERSQALMVTVVHTDDTGSLPVASLFSADASRTPNGALSPQYRWNIQDIEITPVSGNTWTSSASNLTYNTKYSIALGGDHPAKLVVTMTWNEQELKVGDTIKYEGLADVEGTLDGTQVEGSAWLELQPAGHL